MIKSISFNNSMVIALLRGDKSSTRRPLKVQPSKYAGYPMPTEEELGNWIFDDDHANAVYECPFKKGDEVWVKEDFQIGVFKDGPLAYKALLSLPDGVDNTAWLPPENMPQWASRITIKITGVRIERIQDISEHEAQAEGAKQGFNFKDKYDIANEQPCYRDGFILDIWNEIYNQEHKPEFSWDKNPWVWVIDFEIIGRELL